MHLFFRTSGNSENNLWCTSTLPVAHRCFVCYDITGIRLSTDLRTKDRRQVLHDETHEAFRVEWPMRAEGEGPDAKLLPVAAGSSISITTMMTVRGALDWFFTV